jgi:hypothetical protein
MGDAHPERIIKTEIKNQMEQSKIEIERTIEYFESLGIFKNLSSYQQTMVLHTLNNIAVAGYNDARTSFKV